MVHLVGPKDAIRKDKILINTTSRSPNWGRNLSPFFLGPINLYHDYVSRNMENAWQYCKVYPSHVDENDKIKNNYYRWSREGWGSQKANRYPMGKGAKPLFSLWDKTRLSYTEARRRIYIPLYTTAVYYTSYFKQLTHLYETFGEIHLWDFDVYNHRDLNKTWDEVIDDPNKKFGHAFILAMLLEEGYEFVLSKCTFQ